MKNYFGPVKDQTVFQHLW